MLVKVNYVCRFNLFVISSSHFSKFYRPVTGRIINYNLLHKLKRKAQINWKARVVVMWTYITALRIIKQSNYILSVLTRQKVIIKECVPFGARVLISMVFATSQLKILWRLFASLFPWIVLFIRYVDGVKHCNFSYR